MTPLSGRFAVPALALLVAAAALVWVRLLASPAPDACGDSLRAGMLEAVPGTVAARESTDLPSPAFSQWTEGEIAPPSGAASPLQFRIVRSVDPTVFYKEPTRYFSLNAAPDAERGLRWLDAAGERLPVHWRYDDSEATYVIQYFFVQDGRPVRHPLAAGLANAARQIVQGPRPITLVLVDGLGPSTLREAIERRADDWLRAAWQRYREGCRG